LLAPLLRTSTERVGAAHGLSAAGEWRIVTFGGMSALLDRFAVDRFAVDRFAVDRFAVDRFDIDR
jgi:hypothetical protein